MKKKYKAYELQPSFRITISVPTFVTFETSKPIIEKECKNWKKENARLFLGIDDTDLKREYSNWWFDNVYERRVQILESQNRNKVKGKFIAYMMADFKPQEEYMTLQEKMEKKGQQRLFE